MGKSLKTEYGGLSSKVGAVGLVRKGLMLMVVLVAALSGPRAGPGQHDVPRRGVLVLCRQRRHLPDGKPEPRRRAVPQEAQRTAGGKGRGNPKRAKKARHTRRFFCVFKASRTRLGQRTDDGGLGHDAAEAVVFIHHGDGESGLGGQGQDVGDLRFRRGGGNVFDWIASAKDISCSLSRAAPAPAAVRPQIPSLSSTTYALDRLWRCICLSALATPSREWIRQSGVCMMCLTK